MPTVKVIFSATEEVISENIHGGTALSAGAISHAGDELTLGQDG